MGWYNASISIAFKQFFRAINALAFIKKLRKLVIQQFISFDHKNCQTRKGFDFVSPFHRNVSIPFLQIFSQSRRQVFIFLIFHSAMHFTYRFDKTDNISHPPIKHIKSKWLQTSKNNSVYCFFFYRKTISCIISIHITIFVYLLSLSVFFSLDFGIHFGVFRFG